MSNLDVNHLQHLSQRPELWHKRRIGTTKMEAYAVASQIYIWLLQRTVQKKAVYWIVPSYAWAFQQQESLKQALSDYEITIDTFRRGVTYIQPRIRIEFITPDELAHRSMDLNLDDIVIAGMSEVSKWPGNNYPEWVYENLPQRVPIVDYRFRAL